MIHHIIPCTICKKPAVDIYKPFCSKRCQMVDLGRWFDEQYKVPVDQGDKNNDQD